MILRPYPLVSRVADEFAGASLGDVRRSKRLVTIAETIAQAASLTLPCQFPDRSDLELTYRFFGNELVESSEILAPHYSATVRRLADHDVFLVAHDTTTVSLGGEERDFGWVGPETVGFFAHYSLAVSADVSHTPMGSLAVKMWGREEIPGLKRGAKDPQAASESLRWGESVEKVSTNLGGRADCAIHLMDREADAYTLLVEMLAAKRRFIIRVAYDRVLLGHTEEAPETIATALSRAMVVSEREVFLNRRLSKGRSGKLRKTHPNRKERTAALNIRATKLTIQRPGDLSAKLPTFITVNVVEVYEPNPPEGEPPVEWRLLTTEPIDNKAQIEAVVDHYRARWRIEEFFKSLKTGCGLEETQLESKQSVFNFLAVLTPIAWHLLAFRSLARNTPDAPASSVLTPVQVMLLCLLSVRVRLGPDPTLRQALLAVAGLGGHLKNNGDPGWITLGRGFQRLLEAERVASALSASKDQSNL